MDEQIMSTLESGIKHFDSARVTRMHEVMKRHVDSGAVPGLVMLVHHRGREHADAMGTMGYTSKESIQRNTIFRLASMTKPITAVGAMILIEECRVRLDDPVDEWLPELKDRRVLRTVDSPSTTRSLPSDR
jgi:CubicO group peptidase (beta-lactamase class C family)